MNDVRYEWINSLFLFPSCAAYTHRYIDMNNNQQAEWSKIYKRDRIDQLSLSRKLFRYRTNIEKVERKKTGKKRNGINTMVKK